MPNTLDVTTETEDPSLPPDGNPHGRVGRDSNLRTQFWTATTGNATDWLNHPDEFAVAKSEIGVSMSPYCGLLIDLSHAFQRGKTCRKYRIKTPDEHGHTRNPDKRPAGFVLAHGSVEAAFQWLEDRLERGSFIDDGYSKKLSVTLEGTRFVCYAEEQKGVRTFSAMHLDQVTRLSKIPKTWKVSYALRAALSGQIEKWHIDGVYTDDYALDASRNYCRGVLEDYLGKARRIWENRSGWRVWTSHKDEGDRRRLSLSCHNFDNNTIVVDLDAEAIDTERLTCLRRTGEHPEKSDG